MSIDHFKHKRKMVAYDLLAKTRRKRIYPCCAPPAISFEELGVSFKWCGLLDLREAGILTMGTTSDGKAGVVLKRAYADMTISLSSDLVMKGNRRERKRHAFNLSKLWGTKISARKIKRR